MVGTSYDDQNEPEDIKDNMNPRRTRAMRACPACQERHIACGDERPCQRCIRHGLADSCKGGITEMATYFDSTVSFPNIAAHGPDRCSWQQAQTEHSEPRPLTLPSNLSFSSTSAQPAPIPHQQHHTQFTTCATPASPQQHVPLPPRYQLPLQDPQQQQQTHFIDRGPSLQQNIVRQQASRAGTRCVSRLSTAQLARKRATDRESQRVARERTKENIEYLERQIEEQKRQIEEQKTQIKDQNLSLDWMKQRYIQLESEMWAQGAVMTLMLNATTPSNQNNDPSGFGVRMCMP